MKKTLIILISIVLLVSCSTNKKADYSPRQATVEAVVSFIKDNHPNPYKASGRKAFTASEQNLLSICDALEEIDFYLSLQSLVSMVGDSHTGINFFSLVDKWFAVGIENFDGSIVLTQCPMEYQKYLGWKIESIGGYSYNDYLQKLGSLCSWDNQVYLENNASAYLQMACVLRYLGLSDGDKLEIEVSSQDKVESFVAYSSQSPVYASIRSCANASAPTLRQDVVYWLTGLDGKGSLYFQYNQCEESPDAPMSQVLDAIKQTDPPHLVIDLRYNDGGNSQVLSPIIEYVESHPQMKTSVLIGRDTFSSAILNAKALKSVGAVLYGEPTGGSSNHFGEIIGMDIAPNVALFCSTKTFGDKNKMGEPLYPDVAVGLGLESYLNGIDDVVMATL